MNIQKMVQFISFKKAFFIALLVFSFSIIFVDSAKAADWKKTPAQCPSVYEGYGQTGGPGEGMCGVLGNTALWFSTSSLVLLVPTVSTNTNNTPGVNLGGYVVDCHAYDASPLPDGPFCDNNTNFWCSPDPSCNNLYVKTTCNASKWASDSSAFTCVTAGAAPSTTGCISGYANCDGNNSNCEVRIGVTTCTGAGGLQGTLNASCECIVPASNFRTGIQAEFLTSSPLLWGKQYGDGDLIRFTNNAVATSSFVVFNSGQVAIGHNINVSTTSVAFEVSSTQRGILIPRLGGTNPISELIAAEGELYYNTTSKKFMYYNGSAWGELGSGGSSWVTTTLLSVSGNATGLYPAGTVSTTIGIGSTGTDIWLQTSSTPRLYVAENGNVGVGTTSPVFKLSLGDDGGIYSAWPNYTPLNSLEGDVLPSTSSGTLMFWYPRKAAFRAGVMDRSQPNGDAWDESKIGLLSFSFGGNNVASATGTFVVGGANTSSGQYSSITGGTFNNITGNVSIIGGGYNNNNSGSYSFIGAGRNNTSSNDYSVVVGGRNNLASGGYSFVGGGQNNTSSNDYSVVVGGRNNLASGRYSFIGGGSSNNVTAAWYSTIVGGEDNTVSGDSSFVGGGISNTASGYASFVGGGGSNTASGSYSFIGGGAGNIASGQYSSVFGQNMKVYGGYSFGINLSATENTVNESNTMAIMGGNVGIGTTTPLAKLSLDNDGAILAQGTYNSGWNGGNLGAGTRMMWIPRKGAFRAGYVNGTSWDESNIAPFSTAFGNSNLASEEATFIGGGAFNKALGQGSSIIGGNSNTSSGIYSFVGGGRNNNVSGYTSAVFGFENNISGEKSFIGGGDNNTIIGTSSFIGGGLNNYISGENSFIGAGRYNQATGEGATTFGYGNKAGGNYSVALGKYSTTTFNAAYSFAGGEQSMVQSGGFLGLAVSNNSFAYGYKAIAGGVTSFAFGENAIAGFKEDPLFGYHNFWSHAVAIGREAVSRGTASYALGWNSFVDQNNIFSYAIGAGATVSSSNTSSFAIGDNAKIGSNAEYSFALGKYYTNSTANSLGISFNTTQSSNPALHIKGSGTSNTRIGIGAINSGSYITLIDSGSISSLALDVRGSTQIRGTFFLPNINSGAGSAYLCRASGGEVYYSTTACNPSDERLKDVETEINTQLDVFSALDKIRGVYYYWNTSTYGENDGKRQIGVIAQEIETVLPELVYTDVRTTYKSVDYPRLTAFLVEVAKAQQTEIEVLRTAVSTTLSVQQSGGQLTYSGGDLDLQNYALLNVKNIVGTDNKWAIDENGQFITRIQTSGGNTKEMFAMQSPYSEFVFSSSSELVNGEAIINFDSDTCELIDETQPLKVNITLTGECGGIFVKEKSATGFVVKELNGGTSTSTFDWMVIAKRKFATTTIPAEAEPLTETGDGGEIVTTTPPAEAEPLTEQSSGDGGEGEDEVEIPSTLEGEGEAEPLTETGDGGEVVTTTPPVEAEPFTEQGSGDGESTP